MAALDCQLHPYALDDFLQASPHLISYVCDKTKKKRKTIQLDPNLSVGGFFVYLIVIIFVASSDGGVYKIVYIEQGIMCLLCRQFMQYLI